MRSESLFLQFWKGTGWALFFFKFFVFSILMFFVWLVFSVPYGKLLCETAVNIQRSSIPIIDVQYTDYRGITLELLMAPAIHEDVPLADPMPVRTQIYPNTLHFNTIPFLALIFASPVRSLKRLAVYLLIGSILLAGSHIIHMNLNIRSYYYSQQTWEMNPNDPAHHQFLFRIRLLSRFQGFMEQAGSMIVPFLLWMIYAQSWLFRKLRSIQPHGTAPVSSPAPPEDSPK